MVRCKWLGFWMMAAALATAPPAWALTPREVAVVANSADVDSLALARYYLRARGIPKGNLIVLDMPTTFEISRDQYDRQIRLPLARALRQRKIADKIRSLCLVHGVPVRIAHTGVATAPAAAGACRKALAAARRDLVADAQRLRSVAKTFPEVQGRPLSPAAGLFEESSAPPLTLRMPLARLLDHLDQSLKARHDKTRDLRDPDQRRIAARQLMGLILDLRGREGLLGFIERRRPLGAPPTNALRKELAADRERARALRGAKPTAGNVAAKLALLRKIGGLAAVATYTSAQLGGSGTDQSDASVDSELALLRADAYNLAGPRPNPLYWKADRSVRRTPTLMTARIDGPSRADILRALKAALAAEKAGLRGTFYLDAGGPLREYDLNLRKLYLLARTQTRLPCVLDTRRAVFPPGACPNAALYVGWSSPARYVPAFQWVPGAVGWHIAGGEADALHDPDSRRWCTKMIQNGAAATVGAAGDPLLGAFPQPEDFFLLLLTGKWTLAECYWRTVPHASWRMILLGDPLYNPFKNSPQLPATKLPNGLGAKR